MSETDKIEQIRREVQEVIDTTQCGYCKEIFSDVKKIIDTYQDIQDKANIMYDLASKQKKYLSDVDNKAERLINTQKNYYENTEPVPTPSQTPSPSGFGSMLGLNGVINNTNTRGPIRKFINKRLQSANEKMNRVFELRLF
ncbi:MAG: hypothetical protein QXE05_06130 [Nitrososphaeria archaeon]